MPDNFIRDAGVIYSAALSTLLAVAKGVEHLRGRRIEVRFSYGWEERRGEPGRLTVRVHNDSPSRTIHVVQIGWQAHAGDGALAVRGTSGTFRTPLWR